MAKERILVVEDNRDIAKVLELYLNEQGYLVKVTPRGRDALSLSRLELPNLICSISCPDLMVRSLPPCAPARTPATSRSSS
jgi:DNA-binding response OmpR family regulator